jgi:hypothetical protein
VHRYALHRVRDKRINLSASLFLNLCATLWRNALATLFLNRLHILFLNGIEIRARDHPPDDGVNKTPVEVRECASNCFAACSWQRRSTR